MEAGFRAHLPPTPSASPNSGSSLRHRSARTTGSGKPRLKKHLLRMEQKICSYCVLKTCKHYSRDVNRLQELQMTYSICSTPWQRRRSMTAVVTMGQQREDKYTRLRCGHFTASREQLTEVSSSYQQWIINKR